MFSALRHRTAALALGVCFILPVHASSPKPGDFANTQARHIATFFPGRMTGTPAEMLSADYIRQQFHDPVGATGVVHPAQETYMDQFITQWWWTSNCLAIKSS